MKFYEPMVLLPLNESGLAPGMNQLQTLPSNPYGGHVEDNAAELLSSLSHGEF
jgi:hypothetical protein